jgi:hypothetical protein
MKDKTKKTMGKIAYITILVMMLIITIISAKAQSSIKPTDPTSKAWYTQTGIYWKDASNNVRSIIRYDLTNGQDLMSDETELKRIIAIETAKPIPIKNETRVEITPFTKTQETNILPK